MTFKVGDPILVIMETYDLPHFIYGVVEEVSEDRVTYFQVKSTKALYTLRRDSADIKILPWDTKNGLFSGTCLDHLRKLQTDPAHLTSKRRSLQILAHRAISRVANDISSANSR